jgi:hypothetical protein
MGVFAALTGEPYPYTFEGQEYLVSPWTVDVITAFERYMEKRAHDAFDRVAARLTATQAERALSTLMQDITACVYTFGTPFMGKAMQAPEHVKYLWYLCLKACDPKIDRALAKRMAEQDYDGIVEAMNIANQDPNLRKPTISSPNETPATTTPA